MNTKAIPYKPIVAWEESRGKGFGWIVLVPFSGIMHTTWMNCDEFHEAVAHKFPQLIIINLN